MNINPIKISKYSKVYKTIKNSGLFDSKYYLFTYPDVRAQDIDLIKHYIKYGAKEGRNPSAHFDTNYYLTTHKDIDVNKINPLFHYVVFGCKEGRNPSSLFDTKFYLNTYKDVKKSGINPLLHFIKYGQKEGRISIQTKTNLQLYPCKRILDRARKDWNYEEEINFKTKINLEINDFIQKNENYITPFVSIVMPTYNRENSISRAIESVLNQSYNNFELIIVNDYSTDNTENIIKNYQNQDKRIKYFMIDKGGVSKARNKALIESSGEFIFFLDSDNQWRKDFLFIMVHYMLMQNLDAAYSAIAMTSDFQTYDRYIGTEYDYASLLDLNYIDMNAFGFRKKNTTTFFDESLKRLVDWDFILSIVYMHKVEYVPFIGVDYYDGNNGNRITHTESLKSDQNKSLIEFIQKKHISSNLKVQNVKKSDFTIAVVVHVFYLNLFGEILEKLQNIDEKYDLYITTPHDKDEIESYLNYHNLKAKIFKFNNIGRDIGPFLYMLPTLQKYSLVLKLHTKRDVEKAGGSLWREELLKNLLYSKDFVSELTEKFKEDRHLCVAGPENFYINDSKMYQKIDKEVRKKYKECTRIELDDNYGFFAGTMFWLNPLTFKSLEYLYQEVLFLEKIGENHAIEHTLERLFGAIIQEKTSNKICLLNKSILQIERSPLKGKVEAVTKILKSLDGRKGKIFFYPDYTSTNPYQDLMYSGLKENFDIVGGSIEKALEEQRKTDNSIVFHLHWTSVLVGGNNKNDTKKRVEEFIENIKEFKKKRGVFVWTIHNLISHDTKFKDIEIELCNKLSILADNIHIHSQKVKKLVSNYYELDQKKIIIGEHGNYINVYPNLITRENARRKLGLDSEDLIFLFLGQVRYYKGIDELLESFSQVLKSIKRKNVKLIIAGKPVNYDISNLKTTDNSIITDFRVIPDEELQVFLKSADFMIAPYKQILTSGSIYLALSFGIPIIAPKLGLLRETLDDRIDSILYSAKKKNALKDALEYAISLSNEYVDTLKINAYEKAKNLTWDNMQKNISIAFLRSLIEKVENINYELINGEKREIVINKNFLHSKNDNVEIAVIILHYKHLKDTKRAIESIIKQKNVNYELFIVSNDDNIDSFIDLSLNLPDLNIIQSPENLGYAGGNNIAIDIAYKKMIPNILILNPDIEFDKSYILKEMLDFSRDHPKVSILGPRIMYGHKKDIIWFNGAKVEFSNGLNAEHLDIGKKVSDISFTPRGSDYITGACMFIKSELIKEIGLIPEEYFLYFEETDYCTYAKRNGYQLMVVPSIEIFHHKRSEEGGIPSIYYLYYFCRSALLMTAKYQKTGIDSTIKILQDKSIHWLNRICKITPDKLEISSKAINFGIEDGLRQITGKIDLEKRMKND